MIDDIYRVIQIIANKNNYGVITPERFNKLAKDVQLKIITEIPDDLRRAKTRQGSMRSSVRGAKDSINQLQNILDIFKEKTTIQRQPDPGSPSGYSDYFELPDNLQFLHQIFYQNCKPITELRNSCSGYVRCSKYVSPSEEYPNYERFGNKIYIYPESIGLTNGIPDTNVSIYYQRLPVDPNWTFNTINNKPVFNPVASNYQDFELPEYLFDRIVVNMASLIGIHLREQEIEQLAQQEKTNEFNYKITN